MSLRKIASSAVTAWHVYHTGAPVALADVFLLRGDVSIKGALDAGPALTSQMGFDVSVSIDSNPLSFADDNLLPIPEENGMDILPVVEFDTSHNEYSCLASATSPTLHTSCYPKCCHLMPSSFPSPVYNDDSLSNPYNPSSSPELSNPNDSDTSLDYIPFADSL